MHVGKRKYIVVQDQSHTPLKTISLGIPLDENASYLRGAAAGPAHIRQALHNPSSNTSTESGLDLADMPLYSDLGDLALTGMPEAFGQITTTVRTHVEKGTAVLALGGDHSITYPIIQGFSSTYRNLTILHLDAHGDLYDDFEGNRYSHACPFARIMEAGLASRLVQVGVRTLNAHQRAQARRFGVTCYEMKDWHDSIRFQLDGPVYISLDLDVLDPAFAPGVSHHEPGGFSTRQVLSILQHLPGTVVGADIVELNPTRDLNGITAMVAAKLAKELIARMVTTENPRLTTT